MSNLKLIYSELNSPEGLKRIEGLGLKTFTGLKQQNQFLRLHFFPIRQRHKVNSPGNIMKVA